MEYLSLDIWMEILSRLGVKDLIRFKSVSKTFFDLISNDDFIRLHLNKSSFRAIHQIRYTILYLKQHGEAESSFRAIHIIIPSYLSCLKQLRREADGIETISYGSCNGLVCLLPYFNYNKYAGGVLLWNPALCQAEFIPIKRPQEIIYSSWFGYDNDEYKLILGTASHIHLIRLYIDTDSWKSSPRIDKYYCCCEVQGTLVHRTVHWPEYNSDSKITIMSYDLSSETVGWIATPDGVNDLRFPVILGQVDGCLSIYYNTEVWVMKEYAVHESWTKLMIFATYRHTTLKPYTIELDDPTQLSLPIYDKDFYVESLISPSSIKQRYAH